MLTRAEKIERLQLLENVENVLTFKNERLTIAFVITGVGRGKFAVAICAKDEPKFSRKRGELLALRRFADGQVVPFEFVPDELMEKWSTKLVKALVRN